MPVFTERRCGQLIDLARKSVSLKGHRVFPIPQLAGSSPGEHQRRESLNGNTKSSLLERPPATIAPCLHFIGRFKSHDARAAVSPHIAAAMPSSFHGYGQLPAAAERVEVTEHETKRKLLQKHQELQFKS